MKISFVAGTLLVAGTSAEQHYHILNSKNDPQQQYLVSHQVEPLLVQNSLSFNYGDNDRLAYIQRDHNNRIIKPTRGYIKSAIQNKAVVVRPYDDILPQRVRSVSSRVSKQVDESSNKNNILINSKDNAVYVFSDTDELHKSANAFVPAIKSTFGNAINIVNKGDGITFNIGEGNSVPDKKKEKPVQKKQSFWDWLFGNKLNVQGFVSQTQPQVNMQRIIIGIDRKLQYNN
ncbi:UNKNOWN [Stylonychia lemnae]|uniref:Uncharacterized protein n=1 Tax=Stylonychia lemnae TaxID=5949 RepID=A0A078AQH6_STYLE|nr:UNKNOWN [Stylonychia lemnae]|eukprot:CDW84201.1 UNKNOWN [Stylonychia lemnae]